MIPRSTHSDQDERTTNEKYYEKEKPPKNSTIKRFPVTLKALNNYDRDLRRHNNHQNAPRKHQISK
jgi:hypothetical protein